MNITISVLKNPWNVSVILSSGTCGMIFRFLASQLSLNVNVYCVSNVYLCVHL